MLLVFDGPDKAGKSTLIESLERNDLVYHSTRPFKPYSDYSIYIKAQYETIASFSKFFIGNHLILDRFLLSEYCYSQLTRDEKVNKDSSYIFDIDKQISDNAVLIYVTANSETIKKRIVKAKEKEITIDDVDTLLNAYYKYLKMTKIPYMIIDTTYKTIKDCNEEILSFLHIHDINL